MESLFVIAHPDDEVIFAHAMRASRSPHVLIATTGKASTVDYRGDRFVASGGRLGESLSSLARLGVAVARQHYPLLPDGEVATHSEKLKNAINKLAIDHSIGAIYSFGRDGFDGHADHIATYEPASSVAKSLGLAHLTPTKLSERSRCFIGDGEVKKRVLLSHPSQFNVQDLGFFEDLEAYLGPLGHEKYRVED